MNPDIPYIQDEFDDRGERRFRFRAGGETMISYRATVDNGALTNLPMSARQHDWADLPRECFQYLTPSRFCPSERFSKFVADEFASFSGGGRKVLAVVDWIQRHISYIGGISNSMTDAERTFIDRAGICRDFSHLGITFCRALNIPARIVSAYAWRLDPPDFHAVFEVFLDGSWWMIDPTRLAPVEGLVRIGVGRDAADIAFLTTSDACTCLSQWVAVTPAE